MRLDVPQWRQQGPGDCLAACTAMVLAYLGERVAYNRLVHRLGTTESGTFFAHLDRLRSWRLAIERAHGTLAIVQTQLETGRPVIVPVDTELLPYWMTRPDVTEAERITNHAVVVVGMDDHAIYVNDPDFDIAPQAVERGWFLDAWRHHEQWYVVIRRRWPRPRRTA